MSNLEEGKPRRWMSKRGFLKLTGGALLAGAGSVAYGFGIEPNLVTVKEVELKIPRLPKSCEGLRIAQLSDIHFELGEDESLLEELVRTVNDLNVDVMLHTGDFVTQDMGSFSVLAEYIAQMKVNEAAYAIMGNHDVWHGNRAVIRTSFEKMSVAFLDNAWSKLNLRGESLYFTGLDSVWGGYPNISKTFAGVPVDQTCFTLMHEPDFFDEIAKQRDRLVQFSGHTHGGQCRVPLLEYAPVKVKYGKKYIDGLFGSGQEQQLYVSSGIGTVGLRVRFACVPEVVLFTLVSC